VALLFDDSPCAICGKPLDLKRNLFATSGVFFPPGDPLWRFCDAGMHWSCYADWPERSRFARTYVLSRMEATRSNPFWSIVHFDDHSFVEVRFPIRRVPGLVKVWLLKTGSSFQVPLNEWQKWLESPDTSVADHPLEMDALLEALPHIRTSIPTEAWLTLARPRKTTRQ